MKEKVLKIAAPLALITISLFILSLYLQNTKEETKPNKPETQENYEWKVPELPTAYEWKKIDSKKTSLLNNSQANYKTRPKTEGDFSHGRIHFKSGETYTTVVTDEEFTFSGQEIWQKVNENLEKRGWKQSIYYKDFQIMGTAADGPTSSIIGYLKEINGQLRTIIYSHSSQGTQTTEEGVPFKRTTFIDVFVSDPINLEEVLPE